METRCVPASGGVRAHALQALAPAARAVNSGGSLVITGSGTFTVTTQLNAANASPRARLAAARHAAPSTLASGTVKITAPGHKTVVARVRNVSSVQINGGAGSDTITVNGRVPDHFSVTIDPRGGGDQVFSSVPATIIGGTTSSTGASSSSLAGQPSTGSRQSSTASINLASLAQQVVSQINQVRATFGLNALSTQDQLMKAADFSSGLMAASDRMSHDFPDTPSLQTLSKRISAVGYQYLSVGENVASGYSSAADVVAAWMASASGHRETLLTNPARDIGASVGRSASGTLYISVVIGYPSLS